MRKQLMKATKLSSRAPFLLDAGRSMAIHYTGQRDYRGRAEYMRGRAACFCSRERGCGDQYAVRSGLGGVRCMTASSVLDQPDAGRHQLYGGRELPCVIAESLAADRAWQHCREQSDYHQW